MVGPVYSLELRRALRRGWHHLGRWSYASWLVLELIIFAVLYSAEELRQYPTGLSATRRISELAYLFETLLVGQHFALLIGATPTLAAGSISEEKTRGTLAELFETSLSSWEIVRDKWIGQLVHSLVLSSVAAPVICLVGAFAGHGLGLIIAVTLVTICLAAALGAAGILASVWCRKTTTAVFAVWLCGAMGLSTLWVTGLFDRVNPLAFLVTSWQGVVDGETLRRLVTGVAAWGLVAVACILLAVWRLRPAYMSQLEAGGRWHRIRLKWLERSPVSDLPIRWKERYAGELASLPGLRNVPRRAWLCIVVALTIVSSASILWAHLPSRASRAEVFRALGRLDFVSLHSIAFNSAPCHYAFLSQGFIVTMAGAMVVGVRASGSVTAERERLTWEGLLLTPLTTKQLIRGKVWGIIDSARPYLLAYLIPATALSVLGGPVALYWTVYWWALTWLVIYFMAGSGIEASVRSTSSWRALLSMMASAGKAFLTRTILLGLAIGFFVTVMLINVLSAGALSSGFISAVAGTVSSAPVAVLLFAHGEMLLMLAETNVAKKERVRQHRALKERPRDVGAHL